MEFLVKSVLNRRNVVLTNLQCFERSRFLLNSALTLLAKQRPEEYFWRIVHVCDKPLTLDRVHLEAQQLPFGELGVKVTKLEANASDPIQQSDDESHLILCTLSQLIDGNDISKTSVVHNAVIIFDGITLESLESRLCEVQSQNKAKDDSGCKFSLPKQEFAKFKSNCWSFVVACNPPLDGFEAELDCSFSQLQPNINNNNNKHQVSSSVLTKGPNSVSFTFNTNEKDPRIHDEVGSILEDCVKRVDSGGILVFFPTYGRMIEYHSAWQKSGLWDRLGVPYGRENRGADHFKNGLISMVSHKKSVFLCSIRYHQDENLAEYALAQARAVLVVGLPYPFSSDILDYRIKYNNEAQKKDNKPAGIVSGDELCKYRAMEFMNGVLKRCLNEYRSTPCGFFLLDSGLEHEPRNRFPVELGEMKIGETVIQSMDRFDAIAAYRY